MGGILAISEGEIYKRILEGWNAVTFSKVKNKMGNRERKER